MYNGTWECWKPDSYLPYYLHHDPVTYLRLFCGSFFLSFLFFPLSSFLHIFTSLCPDVSILFSVHLFMCVICHLFLAFSFSAVISLSLSSRLSFFTSFSFSFSFSQSLFLSCVLSFSSFLSFTLEIGTCNG